MAKIKKLSGIEVVKILSRFGFYPKRRKGSHMILIKETDGKIGVVVPLHKELKAGTIKAIHRQARINEEEFSKFV